MVFRNSTSRVSSDVFSVQFGVKNSTYSSTELKLKLILSVWTNEEQCYYLVQEDPNINQANFAKKVFKLIMGDVVPYNHGFEFTVGLNV